MSGPWRVDWLQLRLAVKLRMLRSGASLREAGRDAGVGYSAVKRAVDEKPQETLITLALCKWTGLDPLSLLTAAPVSQAVQRETSTETADATEDSHE